jgi:hypothetical protein
MSAGAVSLVAPAPDSIRGRGQICGTGHWIPALAGMTRQGVAGRSEVWHGAPLCVMDNRGRCAFALSFRIDLR